jgi:hypothetical protein
MPRYILITNQYPFYYFTAFEGVQLLGQVINAMATLSIPVKLGQKMYYWYRGQGVAPIEEAPTNYISTFLDVANFLAPYVYHWAMFRFKGY